MPDFREELTPSEFHAILKENIQIFLSQNGKCWTVIDKIPIGMVSAKPWFRYTEPHALWLPEATSRNKLEAAVKFLTHLKDETPFLIAYRDRERTWANHLCKYGLIRSVGKLRDHFGKGKHAMLYQSVIK